MPVPSEIGNNIVTNIERLLQYLWFVLSVSKVEKDAFSRIWN